MLSGRFEKHENMTIPIVGHLWSATDETANINRIISRVTAAVEQGRSPWLTFHQFRNPTNGQDISIANFEKICAAIAQIVSDGKAVNLFASEFIAGQ